MAVKRKDQKGRILRDGELQRPDGRYMFRYTDSLGERQTEYSWRLVETDAHPAGKKKDISLREKEAMIQKDLLDGINTAGGSVSLNELFERYLRTKRGVTQNVKDNYEMIYNKHIRTSYIGERPVKEIYKNDVLALYETISDTGLCNGTIQNIHNNILFPTLQMAVDNDLLRKNPAKDCLKEYPYDVANRRNALTLDEQKRFTDFLKSDKVYCKYEYAVRLILETALRRGEALGLTWNNVDLKNKVIKVDHQLHYYSVKGKYKFEMGKPKTDSGKRVIPLSKEAVTVLQEVKKKDYFNSLKADIEVDGYKNFLFLNAKKSNVIIPRQFSDALIHASEKYNKKELEQAEEESREPQLLPVVTPHILRHTSCTRMAEKGIDIKVLQAIMGHKKADVTMDIYNHVDLHRITREFERMNCSEAACSLG